MLLEHVIFGVVFFSAKKEGRDGRMDHLINFQLEKDRYPPVGLKQS